MPAFYIVHAIINRHVLALKTPAPWRLITKAPTGPRIEITVDRQALDVGVVSPVSLSVLKNAAREL